MINRIVENISNCAKIPSFSSYEEHIHPHILELTSKISGCTVTKIPDNNLIIHIPGNPEKPSIALTSHLDKINHFGENFPVELPFSKDSEQITGQLDDTVGIGICLSIMEASKSNDFPPLYLLFSEMEESTGLKKNPELLKNSGKGYHHGMGAERISYYLLENKIYPSLFITIDTTPIFKGIPGLALYSKFWEKRDIQPCCNLLKKTQKIEEFFQKECKDILLINKNNDFRKYGALFNHLKCLAIPSIAIEPAIFPYHQKDERVFISDIEKVYNLLVKFLTDFDLDF